MSASRLNSAIGLGVKRTSSFEERLPQLRRFLEPLGRGQPAPICPLVTDKIADVNHPCGIRRHASQLSRFSETLFVERRLLGAEPRPRGRTLTITSD